MKIIIVGQAPGPRTGTRAFDGLSGDRLARYMGLPGREDLQSRFELLNVLRSYPGAAGPKGGRFPIGRARSAAGRLLGDLRGRRVLLAGKNVAGASGGRTTPRGSRSRSSRTRPGSTAGGRISLLPTTECHKKSILRGLA